MNALPRGIYYEAEPEEVPAQDHPVFELRPVCKAHLHVEVPRRDLDGRPDHGTQCLVSSRVPDPPPPDIVLKLNTPFPSVTRD